VRSAVVFVAEAMLRPGDWRGNMRSVLARLGEATRSSRVHLVICEGGADGGVASLEAEWVAPGISTQIDNPALQGFRWRNLGLARWEDLLSRGDIVSGVRDTFPPGEREALDAQDILSIALVPIFCGHDWWGLIGFDDCLTTRDWSAPEIDILRTAAWIIGAIVERDRATTALEQSRALFRDFAEASADSFWETDPSHRFTRFEGSHQPNVSPQGDGVIGKVPWSLPGIDSADPSWQRLFALLRRRKSFRNHRFTLTDADGEPRYFALSGKPRFDLRGNFLGFRGSGAEVTAEVEARRQAETLRQTLAAAIDSISDGFILYDRDWRLVRCNDRWREMVGDDADLFTPGMPYTHIIRTRVARGSIRSALGREEEFVRECFERRRDPQQPAEIEWSDGRWVRVTARRMPDGGMVVLVSDITALKQREASLLAAKEEAERLHLAKSNFLAAASHDLRQPLHALGLFVAALHKTVRSQRGRSILRNMERSLSSMQAMFHSLLDISKLDAGVLAPERTHFPIDRLMGDLVEEFRPEAEQKGLELRYVPSSATVESDAGLLERVLRNLLANAVRYTITGRILAGARQVDGAVRIEIWDTGVGIPSDQLDKIFEEFHQIADSNQSGQQGLGLGLAIVSRTASLLGHPVDVRSKPGRGSVFSITVPTVSPEDIAPGGCLGETMPVEPVMPRSRVLVIDDDDSVLTSMCDLLGSWSCTVDTARSPAEAEALVKKTPPDVIIADYRLGTGETGIQTLDDLRTRFALDVPGILITGDTAPDRLKEARTSGYHLLHKPLQPARLRTLLAYVMGNAGRRKSKAEVEELSRVS